MAKAETNNTLSRRFLVASAATLPALAVPAVATAVTAEPDPIYAAIKACVAAERADAEAMEQFNLAEDRFKAKYGFTQPDAIDMEIRAKIAERASEYPDLTKISEHPCTSHLMVDKFIDVLQVHSDKPGDGVHVRARLHEELDRQTEAYRQDVEPFKTAMNDATDEFNEAIEVLLNTEPTTLAGLAALFACLRDNNDLRDQIGSDYSYINDLITSLAGATSRYADRIS
jgi:hypothetical protein